MEGPGEFLRGPKAFQGGFRELLDASRCILGTSEATWMGPELEILLFVSLGQSADPTKGQYLPGGALPSRPPH